jgi:3-oxoacyl-[acyl-carrier protein] reductase
MELREKSAIVTGGGTGVGRATAMALAWHGCNVVVSYSNSREGADETAREVNALGARSISVQADVTSDADCRRLVAEAVKAFGRLDVLVNCAGTTEFIPFDDLERVTDDVWDRIFKTNVIGAFHCARAVRSAMLADGGGAIINVSSVAAQLGQGSCIPYCCSKAALDNLTLSLARTFAPHIRVNAVAPGFITGRWTQEGMGENYERTKQAFEATLPLRKVCEADDVAECIVSLLAGSDLVTGQTLAVDGGMMIAGFGARVS